MFKYAVDILTADPTGATAASTPMVALMPATLLLGYGAARAGSALFNELRNAVFAKVNLVPYIYKPLLCPAPVLCMSGTDLLK